MEKPNRSARPRGFARPAWLLLFLLLVTLGPVGGAVAPQAGGSRLGTEEGQKARALIEESIEALGGQRFLGVTGIHSKGIYTPYSKGRSGLPTKFVDVLVFPDKERTEFGEDKKHKVIQANVGETGWLYDANRSLLEQQSSDQLRAFQHSVRGNIENVLRSGWRSEGVKLLYLGREELLPRKWAEKVQVAFPDGFNVELLFDPTTKLPMASRYRDADRSTVVEVRYNFYIDQNGIKVPRFVDVFRNGVQTMHVVNEEVTFDPALSDDFFRMPANIKELTR